MAKLTVNMKEVLKVLVEQHEGQAFAIEVHKNLPNKTFNSVNATLAAMAGEKRGLVTKAKVANEDLGKVLTQYTVTEAGAEAELEATKSDEDKKED